MLGLRGLGAQVRMIPWLMLIGLMAAAFGIFAPWPERAWAVGIILGCVALVAAVSWLLRNCQPPEGR